MEVVWYLLAAALVLVGLLGTVLPALPGLPFVFAGMLLAAWAGDFKEVGTWTIVFLGAMTAVSLLVDLWATAIGAKRVGASGKAIVGSVLGTLGGLPFGLPGLLLGPFLGALAGELLHQRRNGVAALGPAAKVGFGTWMGIAMGIALKLAIAFAMIALFVTAWIL